MLFLCVLSPVFYIYFKYSSQYERRDGVLYQDVIPRNAEPLRKAGARFSRKSLYVPDGMQKKREMNFLWFESFSKERASETYPLVVVLHGSTGYSYAADYLSEYDITQQYPAYILVPMAPAYTSWSGRSLFSWAPPELPHVVSLINALSERYPIDKKRIYVIGCSMGGYGVFYAAKEYSDIFAAGVSISGAWDEEDAKNMRGLPLYIMAGKRDKAVPYERTAKMAEAIAGYGGDVQFSAFNMGHNCPSSHYYTRAVWRWMFSKTLNE